MAADGDSGTPINCGQPGHGRSPWELVRRLDLPGWNIIHSGQQERRGQPHEGREHGLSHIGARGYQHIEVSGYQDIEISGYRDNRILRLAGLRDW